MEALLSFFSVLKSEINWLISLVSSANTDNDQAQADASATHDSPPTEHMPLSSKDAASAGVPAADTASDTTSHHAKDDQPQLPAKIADDEKDDVHYAFDSANDEDSHPHLGGSLFAFDSPVSFEHATHAASAAIPSSFSPLPDLGIPGSTAPLGDLNIHPLPSLGNPNTVLIDDGNGTVVFSLERGGNGHGGGGHGGGGHGGGIPPPSVTIGTAGTLQITLIFDSSVSGAPSGFIPDVTRVAQFFHDNFTDPTHITIDVGYGEVGGSRVPASALGESLTYLSSVSYNQLITALKGDGGNTADGRDTLPTLNADPTPGGNGNYWVSTAEGKALGLLPADDNIDGYVGFSSFKSIFDYNTADGLGSKQYDFVATAAHEMSEVMGRMLFVGGNVGGSTNSYDALDLFHFSAGPPVTRDFSGTTAGYFSIDGGNTNLHNFNTVSGADFGDWASSATADAYDASGGAGQVAQISPEDVTVMDAIGWNGLV